MARTGVRFFRTGGLTRVTKIALGFSECPEDRNTGSRKAHWYSSEKELFKVLGDFLLYCLVLIDGSESRFHKM